ncbi:HK97 family phage prohead protease [Tessaracoccus sp. MC1865]|uniref:HK97 family phage prohead protease n=1 Tax=Tessaracoccus sp. MC1865 TaxID=2760310 RepID=UPI001604290C|nr:HK97 family phage prohead protease [Tessaracoccus sp. MC1865]MBB1482498.1 HK97 family phage prohead protease [Tessaracoccus sp. MC1865]QTO38047.1 HK97 family phage prohead protease [Tessaracoccus sp. MC1865]
MTDQLELREFEVRLAEPDDSGKREFTGIAVPWDTVANIAGLYEERIARGAVVDSDDAKVWWRHEEPVGRITASHDTDEGWEITGVLSRTPRGDEAYTLLRDGVVDRLSIGFTPIEHTDETHDDGSITRTRTKIRVREVSIVPLPAYSGAAITQVREARTEGETPMGDMLTRADLDEVRNNMEEMERELKLAITEATAAPEPQGDLFRSFGEYVKALASDDDRAKRAYAGAVSGDFVAKDGWVGDVINLGAEKQRITKLFRHTKDLPAEGNNVEYGVLKADTTDVDVQTAEGADLVYGKLEIGTATAPVKTLGGWTELTRQSIERTSVGVLDFTFRALYLKYARAVEALTRATLTAAYNDATATALDSVTADFSTQDGVVAGLIELVEHFEDNDANLSGLLVAKDAFLDLLAVPATDRILQITQAPEDKVGTVTVTSLEGNIAGLKVSLWPNAPAGAQLAYDSQAIRTQEAPGAPFRLQDENIVNLSKAFSVYGYASSYVQVRPGLVKIAPTLP